MNKNNKTLIIAEIGNNHEGSYANAKKLVKAAINSGADAIKFQSINPEKLYDASHKERINKLKSFNLKDYQIRELHNYCKKNKTIFFSTPFDFETANKLNKFQKYFKISSSDNNYLDFIIHILFFKKKTLISTGMLTLDEVDKNLIKPLVKKFGKKYISKYVTLMHCVSKYPVEFDLSNIFRISKMKERFNYVDIGYSDHTVGIDASVYSVLLGAKVVEKHFTLDNDFSDFRDHKLSLNPLNFSKLVNKIRKINILMENFTENIHREEEKNIKLFRRSLVANKDLAVNQSIGKNNTSWLRPGDGISFNNFVSIKGKKLKKNVKKNNKIYTKNIK